MDKQRWRQIDQVLQAALELAPERRAAFLDEACAGDAELWREVEELLSGEIDTGEFLRHAPRVGRAGEEGDGAQTLRPGQQIGRYRVETRIGRGGMGEVYKAADAELERTVALKTLPAAFTSDTERVRRFTQEAIAASRLNHPNILTVYEIIHTEGRGGGAHFIATEFVEGQTLRELLTAPASKQPRRLSVEQALEIVIQITSALEAAHTAWIIHRDIKPENVMLRKDGLVKVLDFGIAKLGVGEWESGRVGERETSEEFSRSPTPTGFTLPGVILGTASYMSPEQARGEELDGRTDIFSLGVLLYEMVTGERLDRSATRAAVAASNSPDAPLPPEAKFERAPKELEPLLRRMLRRQREERYATAGALLADLKRLKRRRENRTARRVVGVSALVVVAALALVALAAALSVNEVWREQVLRDGHTAAVRRAVFSPDGQRLVSVGEDNRVIVWDFARRERLATFDDHQGWVTALAFAPDGKWFASAGADGVVIVWSAARLEKVATLPGHHGVTRAIAFSADGRFLVTPTDTDEKNIWAVGTWQKVRTIITADFKNAFFLLSPDGRLLVTPMWVAYELGSGRPWNPYGTEPFWAVGALAPDNARLISAGSSGGVMFWDSGQFRLPLNPRLLTHQRVHQDHGRAAAWSPDGRLAASGAEDIVLWDAASMTKLARLKHSANVMSLAFSPDSRWLVSTHADGAMLLWDGVERELAASFNQHSDSVRTVAYAPDGRRVASAGTDRSVIIWEQATGRKEMVLHGHARRVVAAAFSADSSQLASCDMDGNVIVWDLAQRRPRLCLAPPRTLNERASYCLALAPDGRHLATSFGVYELTTQRLVVDFPTRADRTYWHIYSLDFARDGRTLAAVTTQGLVLLWDVATWRLHASQQLPQANLVSVQFAPDGQQLVTGEDQGLVRLWTAQPLRPTAVIGQHKARIKSVAFSPDGQQIVSAGDDKTIALWDVSRRKLITHIGLHTAPVYAVAFAPDGKRIISGGHDHSVRLYTRQRTLWGRRLE